VKGKDPVSKEEELISCCMYWGVNDEDEDNQAVIKN